MLADGTGLGKSMSARERCVLPCRLFRSRATPMDERDYKGKDSDSPTRHNTNLPSRDWTAAAAQTPPPPSKWPKFDPPLPGDHDTDTPTLPHGTPIPGATQAMPYIR